MTAGVELHDAAADESALLQPFDEQTAFDVASGARRLFALRTTPDGCPVGSAVLGAGALDLFIEQELRARGYGASAAAQLLGRTGIGPLTAWSHEDHPAARALAVRFGFAPVRTLLHLRLGSLDGGAGPGGASQPESAAGSPSCPFTTFRPGLDDAEWLELNARVFAGHPEQGRTTQHDLDERMAEPWFRADDFLVARDGAGRMIGYCWLKVEGAVEAPVGEIYVLGVAPEASARGLGRSLARAGLARLRERGCASAELYVEADNAPAVRLYRALGFADAGVHVQYARP